MYRDTSAGATRVSFHLYRLDGTAINGAGVWSTANNTAIAEGNGDIAFDGYGNLFLVAGGATNSRMVMLRQALVPITGNITTNTNDLASTPMTNPSGGAPAGLAFPFGDYSVWAAGNTHTLQKMTAPGTATDTKTYSGFPDQRDLASIVKRPTFQLALVVDGTRVNVADQFVLNASPSPAAQTRTTSGTQGQSGTPTYLSTAAGNTPIPVTRALVGDPLPGNATSPQAKVPFSLAGSGATNLALYEQSYNCVNLTTGATLLAGAGVSGTVDVSTLGNATVECTVTLKPAAPALKVSKKAYLSNVESESGSTLAPGAELEYRLLFDNTAGGAAATGIDHVDYLADILDDATFNAGSLTVTGTGLGAPSTLTATRGTGIDADKIQISGSVPAGATRSVSFKVTVKQNSVDPADRAEGAPAATPSVNGYRLNNYLQPATDPAPGAECVLPSDSELRSCTNHLIRAWGVRKDSQPQDGAAIHNGGNIYYRVKVTNYSGESLTGVQLQDDLTQTLAATIFDRAAPPAVNVPNGISFYDKNGNPLTGTQALAAGRNWGSSGEDPSPWISFSADGAPGCNLDDRFPEYPAAPTTAAGCWKFTPPAFDLPVTLDGTPVGWAIVGYAVQGGYAAQANAPFTRNTVDAVQPSATWVNTIQAETATFASTPVTPATNSNVCSVNTTWANTEAGTSGTGIPPGWFSEDEFPGFMEKFSSCKTYHVMLESYFHLWKKDSSFPGSDPSGAGNLVGANFLLADTLQQARDGEASRWLCRVNNNPFEFGNADAASAGVATRPSGANYAAPGSAPAVSGAGDWGQNAVWSGSGLTQISDTYNAIQAWDALVANALPGDPYFGEKRQSCGLFLELQQFYNGQSAGSWLAIDIRGGDTVSGEPQDAPLTNWRTESDWNVAGDSTFGRHGTYWVAEMQSPESFELLAQPMQMWVAPPSPTTAGSPGQGIWYDFQGRLSFPVVGEGEPSSAPGAGITIAGAGPGQVSEIRNICASPWERPKDKTGALSYQPACVMPTGWTAPVFDTPLRALPLTGGQGTMLLSVGGVLILAATSGGIWWWRRRQHHPAASPANSGSGHR